MYQRIFKRLFDIIIGVVTLPFVLLVIVCCAPFIYFTDKGPIFYNATRAGKDYKPFKMFKLRSMYVNSPDLKNPDGSTYNSDDDPRVTPIGKIMRKTSLDEFPQFLNVLKGDISFIGPRPKLYCPEKYPDGLPEYMKTFVNGEMPFYKRLFVGLKEYSDNIIKAQKTLKTTQYDVVHLNTSASISLFKDLWMIHVAHNQGAKIAIHFHFGRIPQLAQKNNWEWKLLQMVVHKADMVITMAQTSYSVLQRKCFTNVHYLPNPLSQAIIDQISQQSTCVKRVPRSILFVGHVIPSKGVFELAKATVGLNDCVIHIVGKCPEETKKELLSINDKLEIVGEIPHDQVIKEMLGADIFVLPSYTEGFPNVILESMACGCATIATSVGAIPEMLNQNTPDCCGVVIPPQNSDALRSAIMNLMNDAHLCDVLREKAMSRVCNLYSVNTVWNQLVDIWKS